VRPGTAFMFRIKYNNAPRVLIPLTDQTVTVSSPLAYTIPSGAFSDPDVNDVLTLSPGASPALPAWLNFDPVAGAFSGTPGVVGVYPVAVVATDLDGLSATNQFNINVIQVPGTNYSLSLGFQRSGTANTIVVSLSGMAGATYKLQRSTSLAPNAAWSDVGTGTADVNGSIMFSDQSAASTMFYRAVLQ
jgi:hypothetical protein